MSALGLDRPPFALTRWHAVAAGLCIAGAFIVGNEIYGKVAYHLTEPTAAPVCYRLNDALHEAGTKQIPFRGERDRSGQSIEDRLPAEDTDRLTLAHQVCTPSSCDRKAWQAYRSAIFWYLSSRLMYTSRLDREYGDAGLARAREVYASPLDRQVEAGLRARYRAKVFRINDFRQHGDAIATLVLQGGEALRPCRSTDATTKYPG